MKSDISDMGYIISLIKSWGLGKKKLKMTLRPLAGNWVDDDAIN